MDTSAYSQEYLDASKQGEVIGVCTLLIVISVGSVALRFYARSISRMDFSWDDWFCLAGLPFALLSPIFDLIQLSNGFGKHQVTVTPARLECYGYLLYILLFFYNPGLVFFELSFLAFYLRLFPILSWLRRSAYTLGAMILVWFLITEFAFIFRCNPISAAWNPAAGTCIDEHTVFLAQSVPTICFDPAILVLPIRLVWNLKMALSSRIGVISIFMLGGVVTVISIARLVVTLTSNDADLTCM
ncbi:uncharacterized protein BDZ99DRAFT_400353 [Mytilinidion resinicola]|uniref:Rhodopsin domain-containing protein n=1 Tax=Mytilinidion resinicola TaxID=574789 RepID=A0A6A6Y2X1_9PEZI|nr:uncharacterized protein BDZ99DRAFT_400353 [Mytilinidion resinicola]KAF2803142.1 hypothetical protein BDZ99DRAFT_400353 [Mytilinidion resinicola]